MTLVEYKEMPVHYCNICEAHEATGNVFCVQCANRIIEWCENMDPPLVEDAVEAIKRRHE